MIWSIYQAQMMLDMLIRQKFEFDLQLNYMQQGVGMGSEIYNIKCFKYSKKYDRK